MEYAPLALRSHQIWREIEAETKTDLFTACGGLILMDKSMMGRQHGSDNFLDETKKVAKKFKIEHEMLSADDVRSRFPQFRLDKDYECYYEPGAGFVRPEAAVRAQLELADRHRPGVRIQRNERVLDIDTTKNPVVVQTNEAEYTADKAVIAAGPWVGQLVGRADIAGLFTVYRQVLHWFALDRSTESLAPDRMPVFVWAFGPAEDDTFYGFPAIDGPDGGLKVATEQYRLTSDPDNLDQEVTAEESRLMFDHYVAGRLPLRASMIKASRCLYTVTSDRKFVIDRHPANDNVLIASPCSGHGFKHSAAIGEALAQWLTDGRPGIDLSPFSFR